MKLKNIISVLVFAIYIFSFSSLCYLKTDAEHSESERRPLAQMPDLSASNIASGEFMGGFEEYTADQFPFRESFRKIKAFFSRYAMQKLENNGLFVADGHISKIDSDENEYMMDYSAERFKNIYNLYLKDKNTNIYLSIVPDKNHFLAKSNGYPSLDYDAFTEKMKSRLDFMQYIDITPLLSLDDYYTTDSHWKQEAITDIAEKLALDMGTDAKSDYQVNTLDNAFYGVYYGQAALPFKADTIKYLTNDTIDNCIVNYYDTGSAKKGDMYNMKKAYDKDPYEMFLSGSAPLVTIENPKASNSKELVIFRDSFGSSLAPLLAEGYKKITLVDIRYIQSSFVGNFVDFENKDVLFIYSTELLNNSLAMK